MTDDEIKAVLKRVLTWPPDRQRAAAEILVSIEAQDTSTFRLTDAQAAEVRERLSSSSAQTIPFEEVFRRFRPSGA